jgi:hypothetical protein
MGAATGQPGERLEAVVKRADLAMFEQKRAHYARDMANCCARPRPPEPGPDHSHCRAATSVAVHTPPGVFLIVCAPHSAQVESYFR